MTVSLNARLTVGEHVYPLGEVSGSTSQGLCDDLADRLEELARIIRGNAVQRSEVQHWVPISDEALADQRQIAAWYQRVTGGPR